MRELACVISRAGVKNSMIGNVIFMSLVFWSTVSIAMVAGLTPYSFDPAKLDGLVENDEQHVQISCNGSLSDFESVTLKIVSADSDVAVVSSGNITLCHCEPLAGRNLSQFVIKGHFLGRTVINVETVNATQLAHSDHTAPLTVVNDSLPVVDYHVSIVRKERFIDHLFLALVSLMVICANVGMGCKIDLVVVKEVLRKPIAPAIGFSCQYLIMPLVCVLLLEFIACL